MAAALGINLGCERVFVMEYGTPYAEFEVKGVVTDEEGNPIRNIEVKLTNNTRTVTSETGLYSVKTNYETPNDPQVFHVAFNDVDGAENGSFKNDTVDVAFHNSELTNPHGWSEGSASKIVNVVMHPADAED